MKNEYLTYDNVSILPKFSEILHRADCDVSTRITRKLNLKIPVISSPMDTVTEYQMAVAMHKVGGLGVIHRFMSIESQVLQVYSAAGNGVDILAAAIGVTGDFIERAQDLVNVGCDILVIDVAHGHHILVKDALRRLKNEVAGNFEVIAGSIATKEAARDLCKWGADGLRVGIASGAPCITRYRTSIYVPQLSAIIDCVSVADNYDIPVIADGGIRHPGDVAKAIAAGADVVMLGSLLSGTKESPGIIHKQGDWPTERLYKTYRGSASRDSKLDRNEEDKNIEGLSIVMPYTGKVKRIVTDILDGLRSSMSYVGALNIQEFQEKAELIKVYG